MENEDVSTAALLEIQVVLERYLSYSFDAREALDKILAIVDRPEVAHTLDSDLNRAPIAFVQSNSFASFP